MAHAIQKVWNDSCSAQLLLQCSSGCSAINLKRLQAEGLELLKANLPEKKLAKPNPQGDLWTAQELDAIITGNLVGGPYDHLQTFCCIQWECEVFNGRSKARCYPFDIDGCRFRNKNPASASSPVRFTGHGSASSPARGRLRGRKARQARRQQSLRPRDPAFCRRLCAACGERRSNTDKDESKLEFLVSKVSLTKTEKCTNASNHSSRNECCTCQCN